MNTIENKTNSNSNSFSIPTAKLIGLIGFLGVVSGAAFRSPLLMSLGALLVGAYLSPIMPIWTNHPQFRQLSKQTSMQYYFWLIPVCILFMVALYLVRTLFA